MVREPLFGAVSYEGISPIILAGPTLTGKSCRADMLVDHLAGWTGADSITADKYYLYAETSPDNPRFCLGLGLRPGELNDGRQRHLYGSLEPTAPVPTTAEYLNLATQAVAQVHEQGKIAILEGCSYSYTMALIGHFGVQHAVRLTWNTTELLALAQTTSQAFDNLVDLGLYEETTRALDAGYERTYPMSSLIYTPVVQAVRGAITQEDAARLVVTKWIDEACRVDQLYANVPSLYTLGGSREYFRGR